MSTIREDVVTIGFEVEQNPFADLTSDLNSIDAKLGILEDTESGLKNIEKSQRTQRIRWTAWPTAFMLPRLINWSME